MNKDIFEAYENNNLEQMELILKNGGDANAKSEAGLSLFFLTILDNNYPAAALLIKYGADPNLKFAHCCLLDRAVKHCCYEIVELLLKNGANPTVTYPNGVHLLLMYSQKIDHRMIQLLISYGTDYKVCDRDGNNLLMLLASSNETNRFHWNYKLNRIRKYRVKITMNEFQEEQVNIEKELIHYLFEHDFDFNQQNKYGLTALHYALEWGKLKVASQLLECNANPNVKDKLGCSPYYYAYYKQKKNFISLFEKYGGKLDWWHKPVWKWI
jgi:ankyrin repeat protein